MKLVSYCSGSGPDLLLLHGWGMNASLWRPLLERLTEAFRVTCVDLPGHGRSPFDTAWSDLQTWAQVVLEVAPSRAIWLGWSLGGLVMQQAAQMQPQRISALLGVATSPCFMQRADWQTAMQAIVLQQFARDLLEDSTATLGRFLALQVQGSEQRSRLLRRLREWMRQSPLPQPVALQTGLSILQYSDLRQCLASRPQPMSWILGARDTLVPVVLADELKRLAPADQVYVIESAAHAPFLSHPENFMQIMQGCVSRGR